VELFAFKALQGELLNDGDPYLIPQKGYCHAWDCHGGAPYLHEHLVSQYEACWQQGLPNGEIDASVCNKGTSRFLNYYIEGLAWSVLHHPSMDGVYYDGINFSRRAMRRIRRALNNAAAQAAVERGDGLYRRPLMDSHTGAGDRPPPGLAYLSHFPYLDSAWFAEGLNLSGPPAYWLLEASGQIYGISADLLSSHEQTGLVVYRAMLFGMTVRNSPSAESLWKLWDAAAINETTLVGWWEPATDRPIQLSLSSNASNSQDQDQATHDVQAADSSSSTRSNCSIVHTGDSFPSSSGGASGNVGFGGKPCGREEPTAIPAMTAAEASAYCCDKLAGDCVGFSFDAKHADVEHRAGGCFKKNADGGHGRGPPGWEGYTLHGLAPPRPGGGNSSNSSTHTCGTDYANQAAGAVLVSTFSAFESHAVVVIASWCEGEARLRLHIDWEALGTQTFVHPLAPCRS
jgi:hypothetical protein